MTVKIRQKTTYVMDDDFELTFPPEENSITVKETAEGFTVGYLVQDTELAMGPDDMSDDGERGAIFLVHYHRDFQVENKDYITEDDLREWYQHHIYNYEGARPIPQEKEFWIFPVAAYIHSGVRLSLGSGSHFPDQRWDVSHVGAVLVNKKAEKAWRFRKNAEKAAEALIEEWNQYLSGDVWGVVYEKFSKDKESIDHDSCWGYYGYDYALKELKGGMEHEV